MSVGIPRSVDIDELAIAVASRSTLPVLVDKSALTLISTAVGDVRTMKGELTMPSPEVSLTKGNEAADAVSKGVGSSG